MCLKHGTRNAGLCFAESADWFHFFLKTTRRVSARSAHAGAGSSVEGWGDGEGDRDSRMNGRENRHCRSGDTGKWTVGFTSLNDSKRRILASVRKFLTLSRSDRYSIGSSRENHEPRKPRSGSRLWRFHGGLRVQVGERGCGWWSPCPGTGRSFDQRIFGGPAV